MLGIKADDLGALKDSVRIKTRVYILYFFWDYDFLKIFQYQCFLCKVIFALFFFRMSKHLIKCSQMPVLNPIFLS